MSEKLAMAFYFLQKSLNLRLHISNNPAVNVFFEVYDQIRNLFNFNPLVIFEFNFFGMRSEINFRFAAGKIKQKPILFLSDIAAPEFLEFF